MAEFRLPGPLCRFLSALRIDSGTMCRGVSPQPGPVGAPNSTQQAASPISLVRTDLRNDPERMRELMDHLGEREDLFTWFYCDHRGLVTIGIGHLVDRDGANDETGQEEARRLLRDNPEIEFRHHDTGQVATANEVVDDWQRIKDQGRIRARRGEGYERFAQLRITEEMAHRLADEKVQRYINKIANRRPFTQQLDSYIVMAFVDVLYNPSGVVLFGKQDSMPALWAALDPESEHYDLERALTLFRTVWENRGVERYQERHRMRVAWFRQGVRAMQGVTP